MDGGWSADAQRILNDLQEKVAARDLPALLEFFEDPAVLIGTAGDGRTQEAREAYLEAVTTQPGAVRWDWRETVLFFESEDALGFAAFGDVVLVDDTQELRAPIRGTFSRYARTVAGDCGSSTDRSRSRRTMPVPILPAMTPPDRAPQPYARERAVVDPLCEMVAERGARALASASLLTIATPDCRPKDATTTCNPGPSGGESAPPRAARPQRKLRPLAPWFHAPGTCEFLGPRRPDALEIVIEALAYRFRKVATQLADRPRAPVRVGRDSRAPLRPPTHCGLKPLRQAQQSSKPRSDVLWPIPPETRATGVMSRGAGRGDRLAPLRATSAARIWWPPFSDAGSATAGRGLLL